MVLKKSAYKLQSSLAHYIFTQRELLVICDSYDWSKLTHIQGAIVRSKKDFEQMLEAVRLSVLVNHIEIMRQALYEHIELIGENNIPQKLNDLGFFLFDLRNALSHTRGALIPRWDVKVKTKGTFSVDIPIHKQDRGQIFSSHSKVSTRLVAKVKPNKTIRLTTRFFDQIVLLSYHVLFILKKQKSSTLSSYLNAIQAASSMQVFC